MKILRSRGESRKGQKSSLTSKEKVNKAYPIRSPQTQSDNKIMGLWDKRFGSTGMPKQQQNSPEWPKMASAQNAVPHETWDLI